MKTIEISKASKSLGQYARDLSDDVIIVTSRRKAIAALGPRKSLRRIGRLTTFESSCLAILEKSKQQIQAGRRDARWNQQGVWDQGESESRKKGALIVRSTIDAEKIEK